MERAQNGTYSPLNSLLFLNQSKAGQAVNRLDGLLAGRLRSGEAWRGPGRLCQPPESAFSHLWKNSEQTLRARHPLRYGQQAARVALALAWLRAWGAAACLARRMLRASGVLGASLSGLQHSRHWARQSRQPGQALAAAWPLRAGGWPFPPQCAARRWGRWRGCVARP